MHDCFLIADDLDAGYFEFMDPSSRVRSVPADTYWLTRFVMLRWFGFVYLVAFYVAARQLVPLVGAHGLTPAPLFLDAVRAHFGSSWAGFEALPMVFWINCSDTWLEVVPWIGVALSCVMLAGYANAIMLTVMWILYMSIVHVGQDWYGYGWEIQMIETGFLAIFLCPLLDPRPFPSRPPPFPIIFLFRWLIVRIMLGSALIKLRGDSCWTDLTALYYHFETQPIPNPVSRWFHFLPHGLLQFGTIWTFIVELIAPFFVFWPRMGRLIAGGIIVSFQLTLIVSGNLSFFNWLTILPALACFDDRFLGRLFPTRFVAWANQARNEVRPSRPMAITSWVVAAVIGILSIQPALNLFGVHFDRNGNLVDGQEMNSSFDPLNLVNTYGAFGTVGKERPVVIFEGSNSSDPNTATDWKEYPYVGSPWDPALAPTQIAPYQPHLDWQLWFVALLALEVQESNQNPDFVLQQYPWMLNLVWKMLHNDPATMGLFAGNPFPDHPSKYIRVVLYKYRFAPPDNPAHVYWAREKLGLLLPPLSVDNPAFQSALRKQKLIP